MRKHAKLGLPPKEWEKLVTKDANAKKKEIVARHKVQFWRSIASTAAGVPVWIGMSYFVRSLAGDMEGIMALQGKGFGWIVDLGIPDTTGITGIAFASLMLMNTEYNARQVDTAVGEEKGRTSRIISNILRVMAVLAVPISMGNPAVRTPFSNLLKKTKDISKQPIRPPHALPTPKTIHVTQRKPK